MSNLRRQASMLKLLGGEVYTEHYQQKKELGRGKFGVVYQVEDKATNKIYAAKHIKTRRKEQKEKVRRSTLCFTVSFCLVLDR